MKMGQADIFKGDNKMHKWTVMIYLAGDTNDVLSAEMIFALKEMKEADPSGTKIGPDPDKPVSVVILFDPPSQISKPTYYVINQSTSRSFTKDKGPSIERESVKSYILNLVDKCVEENPAENYMLVLSGHGSGSAGNRLFPGQNPADALSLKELNSLTKQIQNKLGKRLDILALSCCLANMIEICHSLGEYNREKHAFHPYANYLIGPEGFEPLTGWPFKEILESFAGNVVKKAGIDHIAKDIVDQYSAYYQEYTDAGISADLAAINLDFYADLAGSVTNLAAYLKSKNVLEGGNIQLAHLKTQAYLNFRYADLYDFCDNLKQYDKAATPLCDDVQKAIRAAVGNKKGYAGTKFTASNGIGIYLPWIKAPDLYSDLQFARDTKWHEFLDAYYKSRSRPSPFGTDSPTIAGVMIQGESKTQSSLVALPE
jgi:hypothetical protein